VFAVGLFVVNVKLMADLLTGLVFLVDGLCLRFRFNVNFFASKTSPSPISIPSKNSSLATESSSVPKFELGSMGNDARFRLSRAAPRSGKLPEGNSKPSSGASSSLSAAMLETLGDMIDEPSLSSPL
jgi:hypothetical protein